MTTPSSARALPDEATCWHAVLCRDAAYAEQFVYAVRSTKIYCRPTCPSRRPRREHVAFFAQSIQAETAGFRACKRCRPQAAAPPNAQTLIVAQVCRYIDDCAGRTPTLAELGAHVGVSPYHLQRVFKAALGITPRQYADEKRLAAFKAQIQAGDDITGAIYTAGYGSPSRLYEQADERLGMTPTTYQRGGTGMQISYTISDSPLGRLLVAATERGVCAVYIGNDDTVLEADLATEYAKANRQRDTANLSAWQQPILAYLAGQQPNVDLPVDVQATAFQRRVWDALRAIPRGETRTYSQIAETLGNPKAVRAVGRACATNPVSLVVPCHRAVGADGGLRGYRWGLDRKQALLNLEKEPV